MVLRKIPLYSIAINMNLRLQVTCLVGANVLTKWDEGYVPPKNQTTAELDVSAWHVFVWWILESLLRPERIKKDRGKMEDKVWGEDCHYTTELMFFWRVFFCFFFSRLDRDWRDRGKQDWVFWEVIFGVVRISKSLHWLHCSFRRHVLKGRNVVACSGKCRF